MEIFISTQLKNFGYSVILGLIFGGIYDIIRIVQLSCGIVTFSRGRPEYRKGFVPFTVFAVLDLMFLVMVTASFSVFLYAVNYGGFRYYLLVGCIAGMAVYHHTAGRIVMTVSERIVRLVRMVVRLIIIQPIVFICGRITKAGAFIWKHTAEALFRRTAKLAAELYTEYVMRRIGDQIRFTPLKRKGRAQSEKRI